MKMNKFTLGAIAGVTVVGMAIPILAQISNAQSVSSSASAKMSSVPSQACVQAMVTMEDGFVTTMDTIAKSRKTAMQAHIDALKAAAAITDDTQRVAALKKANDDMRTAMKAAMPSQLDRKATMDALRTACGDMKGGKMMGHMFGDFGGPMGGHRGGGMKMGGDDRPNDNDNDNDTEQMDDGPVTGTPAAATTSSAQ